MKINNTLFLLSSFQFFSLINTHAQTTNEFEGAITYSHKVEAIDKDYDINRDYSYIGKQSVFYYKNGNYKWLNENAFIEMDLFRSKDSVEYLKMQSTDSILYVPNNMSNEEIIDYKILQNADTVAGHVCNVLIVKAGSNGNEWTRQISYSSEFAINPDKFARYKYNSTNFLYLQMKAVPLKIQLIYKARKIIYTAINIEKKKLQESFFEFKAGTKFKSLL